MTRRISMFTALFMLILLVSALPVSAATAFTRYLGMGLTDYTESGHVWQKDLNNNFTAMDAYLGGLTAEISSFSSQIPITSFTYGMSLLGQRIADPTVATDQTIAVTTNSLAYIISAASGSALDLRLPPGTYLISNNYTIPASVRVSMDQGAVFSIASGKTLTINGPFNAGLCGVFSGSGSVSFGAGSVKEVYPQWFTAGGSAAILAAVNSQPSGGIVHCIPGTYTITPATIIMSTNNTELRLDDGVVLDNSASGDTDYSIKITGNHCSITGTGNGTGQVLCPANFRAPTFPPATVTDLNKAVIWNTGQDTVLRNFTLYNIPFVGLHNLGGARLLSDGVKYLGNWTAYTFASGYSHSGAYVDGGEDNEFRNNFFYGCAQGIGSDGFGGGDNNRLRVVNNVFSKVGNHCVYLDTLADLEMYNNKGYLVGSLAAVTGSGHKITSNYVFTDPYANAGGVSQSNIGLRNASFCQVSNNYLTGTATGGDEISIENLANNIDLVSNIVDGNKIYLTGGSMATAIKVGTPLPAAPAPQISTTWSKNNRVINNDINVEACSSVTGIIRYYATAADQVIAPVVLNNRMSLSLAFTGVNLQFARDAIIKNNLYFNSGLYASSTPMTAYKFDTVHDSEVEGNEVVTDNSTASTADDPSHIVLNGFVELATGAVTPSAVTHHNRFINNRIASGVTGGSLASITLIAGNGSTISGLAATGDSLTPSTATSFAPHHGHVFHLTGTGRNFNPSASYVWPVGYAVDLYNDNTIGGGAFTYNSSAATSHTVAPGKHGMFNFSGSDWSGSQVD